MKLIITPRSLLPHLQETRRKRRKIKQKHMSHQPQQRREYAMNERYKHLAKRMMKEYHLEASSAGEFAQQQV